MPKVDVNGLDMYYEIAGDGEPLLLIMGLGGDHTAWIPLQVPAFTAGGYRCILFDNRDVGQTNESPAPAYTIGTMTADTVGLMDALGIERAHVLGGSMGGLIAQEIAINHPQRVRSLTLVCTAPYADAMLHEILATHSTARQRFTPEEFFSVFAIWGFTHRFFENPAAVGMARRMMLEHPHPQSNDAFLRQLDAALKHDARDRLDRIRAPTHVVVGAEDILTPPRLSRMLAERIPGAELTVIPECGHLLAWERPDAHNAAILRFLNQH